MVMGAYKVLYSIFFFFFFFFLEWRSREHKTREELLPWPKIPGYRQKRVNSLEGLSDTAGIWSRYLPLLRRAHLVGPVVKASASREEDPGFKSGSDFSRSSHTSDLNIGTPGAPRPGSWRYRVGAGSGRPGVSMLWLDEVESWICNFYLNVAARKIVWADPSLTYFLFFKKNTHLCCLVGCLSMIVWTHAVLCALYACGLYFCLCTCSAQLSMFHMEVAL